MKTRRVLKSWVKVVLNSLVIAICVFGIVSIVSIDSNFNEKEINKCVARGHSTSYCEIHS